MKEQRKSKRYHFIYQTMNIVNGKIYVGCHSTDDLNDDYLGSGVSLSKAIQKYGKAAFERSILEFAETYDELLLLEKRYVDEDFIHRTDTYNQVTGGYGGGALSIEAHTKLIERCQSRSQSEAYREKLSSSLKEKWQDPDYRRLQQQSAQKRDLDSVKTKVSNAAKERWSDPQFKSRELARRNDPAKAEQRVCTEDTKQKISAALSGRKRGAMSDETKMKLSKANSGKVRSEETRRKISEARKKTVADKRQKEKDIEG